MDVWEQQDNESSIAFIAFSAWRDSGATRSITNTAEQLGKSRQVLTGWVKRHDWHARALAWDRYKDAKALEAEIVVRETSAAEYAAAVNKSLQAKLIALDSIVSAELTKLRARQADGESIDLLEMKRLVGILRDCDDLARRSAGLATSYTREKAAQQDDSGEVYYVVSD